MRVLTAVEMREMDHRTAEEFGVPGIVLMENAGRAVADVAHALVLCAEGVSGAGGISWVSDCAATPERRIGDGSVAVICGGGNNGGDGFAAARHLINRGVDCLALLCSDPAKLQGDALSNYRALTLQGVPVQRLESERQLDILDDCSLIIDALYGTGLRGELSQDALEVVRAINRSDVPVLSVDIPSGINADTGQVMGEAVSATITVTFAAPKLGHVLYPGAGYCGEVAVADIGIPATLRDADSRCGRYIITPEMVSGFLPYRPQDSHKGSYGHVGIVAGSRCLTGAAFMAGQAAAVSGAGLTTVAVPAGISSVVASKLAECMTFPVGRDSAFFELPHADEIAAASASWNALGIGCGLGRRDETKSFVPALLARIKQPYVLDADGLFCLGDNPAKALEASGGPGILTPHPGEMARLLGTDTAAVQSDRLDAVREAADRFGLVCVLKGAHTLVAAPKGKTYINLTGNCGQAKGGSGDILTGLIAGLLAQGLEPLQAAVAGVWIHGKAADLAVEGRAKASLLATQCLDKISDVYVMLGCE